MPPPARRPIKRAFDKIKIAQKREVADAFIRIAESITRPQKGIPTFSGE